MRSIPKGTFCVTLDSKILMYDSTLRFSHLCKPWNFVFGSRPLFPLYVCLDPDNLRIVWDVVSIRVGLARVPIEFHRGSLISDAWNLRESKRRYFHLLSLFAVVCTFFHDSLQFRENPILDDFLLLVFVSFPAKETIFAGWFQDANALMTDRSNKDSKKSPVKIRFKAMKDGRCK